MSRLAAILFVAAVAAAACSTVDPPNGTPGTTGSGGINTSTSSGPGGGDPCDVEGELRECKVDIDAHNCFVGVQICEAGNWSECREGSVEQKAQMPCGSNPCNPACEEHTETPGTPLEGTYGGVNPTSTGGQIEGLPDSWVDAGLKDQEHVGMNCNVNGGCSYDYYCDAAGTSCVPWQPGDYDGAAGSANLTIPIVCGSSIQVCNRGNASAAAGVEVNVFDATDPSDIGQATGFVNTLRGSCTTSAAIAPGDCLAVPGCSAYLGGPGDTALIHTNGADQAPPAPISESDPYDNWGIYYDGGTCLCANESIQAQYTDATMYVFLDNSGSMNGGTPDLWDSAVAAVTTFVQDPAAAAFNVAFRQFGGSCCSGSCSATDCAAPALGPDFLSNVTHQNNIIASMPANAPGGCGTPHGVVVDGITQWTSARKLAFPTEAVGGVYITDGNFNGCTPNSIAGVAALTTAAYNGGAGPPTYVVAIGGADVNFCQQVSEPNSNCIDLTASSNPGTDLVTALNTVSSQLVGCSLTIPHTGQINFNTISVDYSPNGMPPVQTFTNVGDAASCTGAADEVYYDDIANPTQILACPVTCTTIKADTNALIEFTAGCNTGAGYQQATFNYEYQGDCSGYGGGVGPVWDFLTYDTTIPGDASVVWEVRTATSQAGLAAQPWTTVSTAVAGSEDVTSASPVLISDYLAGPLLRQEWIELQITVNTVTGGAQTAAVNNWGLQFTCADNE